MQLIPVFKIGVWNGWIFSIIFLIPTLLIPFINKKAYQKLGNPPDMKLSRSEKNIGYISSTIIYLLLIYSIFLPLKLGTPWFYVGLIIFLLAMFIQVTACINFITTPIDKLITGGIYRYSRNPIYLSSLLFLISIGITTASWVILLVSVVFLVLANIVVISEERYCKEKYGNTYREYLNKVPRWIGMPKS
jgi:protein-S-isoprenylcysteine O-methyltransferase Ste14